MPEVVACHHVTGEDAFILQAFVASTRRLDEIIALLGGFGSTATSVVLSTPLKRNLSLAE
jgi:Lrp/AsnC family leucine-responsive transcriptional regulator